MINMIEQILSEPRILVALAMLVTASIMDLRNREVHDLVWIVFGSIGALLYFIEPSSIENANSLLFATFFSVGMAYLGYRMGLFASADALALVALAVIIPIYTGPNMFHNIAPFTILTNAAILVSLLLIFNIARNFIAIAKGVPLFEDFHEPVWKKVLAFIISYKSDNPRFAYSIERESVNGKKFDFSLIHAEHAYYAKHGSWVMLGLPFIVSLLAGLVAMIIVGDILMSILNTLV